MNQLIQLLVVTQLAQAAATLDVTSKDAVAAAASQMAKNLMAYYVPGKTASDGTIFPNTSGGPDGFQWYEGGIMWGAMLEYMKTTGDSQYATTIVNALTMGSFGKTASFLGSNPLFSETVEGKWNDDLLWWALPVVTGAEMFSANAVMPGGVSYFQLANTTYQQVWGNWDTTGCKGGLYWSRDRNNPKLKGYKSTITHGQEMVLGARLAILSGNAQYLQQGSDMYNWLKSSGIVTADYKIYDGVDVDRGCGINGAQLSYKAGFLIGGLSWLHKASGDQTFMTEAININRAALTTFAPNNIITDQCEPKCSENQVSPKGTMIRGLGYLYEFTNDAETKTRLKQVLSASVQAMLKTCTADFQCGNYWTQGTEQQSNVHYQINSLELMTSYLKTFSNGPVSANIAPPTQAPPSTTPANKPKGSATSISASLSFLFTAALLLL